VGTAQKKNCEVPEAIWEWESIPKPGDKYCHLLGTTFLPITIGQQLAIFLPFQKKNLIKGKRKPAGKKIPTGKWWPFTKNKPNIIFLHLILYSIVNIKM
jgi:hypothetical protein